MIYHIDHESYWKTPLIRLEEHVAVRAAWETGGLPVMPPCVRPGSPETAIKLPK
jgi:hypothetical protein